MRAMARLPAPSRPVATARLVYSSTSDSRSAAVTCRAVPAAASPPPTMAGTSSSKTVIPPRSRSAASWRLVWPTCDPTTTRPCLPCRGRPAGQMSVPRSGARGPMPASARTNDGPVRNRNDAPARSAISTPAATVSRSEYSVALTTAQRPSRTPASSSRTRCGPPSLMSDV